MENLRNSLVPAAGRLLLSLLFIWVGYGKLTSMGGTIAYFASDHVPAPTLVYIVAVVIELIGGIALLLGLFTRPVALVLGVWCLATAAVGHGFADMNSSIHAMKNIAICGGFLYVFAYGAGRVSLDALMGRGGHSATAAQAA
jgi:putative oxidoreductase